MSHPYYPSGPPSSGHIFHRSSSIINDTDNVPSYDPPPNQSKVGGIRNYDDEPETEGERHLPDAYPYQSQDHASSFNDVRLLQKSNPGHGTWAAGYDYGSAAPGFEGIGHANNSNTGQGFDHSNIEKKAPGHSGLVHENLSNTGDPNNPGPNPSLNPADYVGISLVGRKFKEVNPSAYYVEKNDTTSGFGL